MPSARWAKPQVWNSGAAMWVRQPVAQRHPRQQRDRRVDAGLVARAPLGVPVVPEVRITIRAWRSGGLRGRLVGRRDQRLEGPGVVVVESVHASTRSRRRRLGEQAGELLVVDHHGGLLALEHVDQLRSGEGGVEVEQVGAELGDRDRGVDEAAVVAAHHRDPSRPRRRRARPARRRARWSARCSSPKVRAPELVDQADLVGRAHARASEPPAGRCPSCSVGDPSRPASAASRADDPGWAEHLGRLVRRPRPGQVVSIERLLGTGQAGVLGAISRVADQSLLTAAVVVWERPGDRGRLGDVGGVDRVGAADLRGQQPDRAAADQVGQRVDEAVDEVAVLVAPPQHDRVDDVAVVAVDHVGVDGVLDGDPEVVVGVVVPAELLDHHAGLEAQPAAAGPGRLSGWTRHPRSSSRTPPGRSAGSPDRRAAGGQ